MKESFKIWSRTYRIVPIMGFTGVLIGLAIGTWNNDDIGWSLLRVSLLGVAFAWSAKVVVTHLMRAWLISKIDEVESLEKAHASGAAGTQPQK